MNVVGFPEEFTPPSPLEGVGSNTAAVVGAAETGPIERVTLPGSRDALSGDAIEANVAVVAGSPARLPPFGRELPAKHPQMHVVAIHGCETLVCERRPFERKRGEISSAGVLDAVQRVGPAGA